MKPLIDFWTLMPEPHWKCQRTEPHTGYVHGYSMKMELKRGPKGGLRGIGDSKMLP